MNQTPFASRVQRLAPPIASKPTKYADQQQLQRIREILREKKQRTQPTGDGAPDDERGECCARYDQDRAADWEVQKYRLERAALAAQYRDDYAQSEARHRKRLAQLQALKHDAALPYGHEDDLDAWMACPRVLDAVRDPKYHGGSDDGDLSPSPKKPSRVSRWFRRAAAAIHLPPPAAAAGEPCHVCFLCVRIELEAAHEAILRGLYAALHKRARERFAEALGVVGPGRLEWEAPLRLG